MPFQVPSAASWRPTISFVSMLRLVGEWELPGEMQLGLMPGIARERHEGHEEGGRSIYGLFGAALEKGFGDRLHGVA